MFTFGILLLISVIHMTISCVFFPHLSKFYHEFNSRLFGPIRWKVILVICAIAGAGIFTALIIWVTVWAWAVLGATEIFSFIGAYRLNKKIKSMGL